MFFLLLTGMLISFVVGTTLLVNGEIVYGSIAASIGILLLVFVLFYYGKKKNRKKKTPDCLDFDCGPDCDGGPDCDCVPNCS
ncbi:MAG: hypothetical protein K0Q87_284 [Neobacillus sp.]|jgi:hypothetical protein|nr:hypothetical protein [Neobacillus sp.]